MRRKTRESRETTRTARAVWRMPPTVWAEEDWLWMRWKLLQLSCVLQKQAQPRRRQRWRRRQTAIHRQHHWDCNGGRYTSERERERESGTNTLGWYLPTDMPAAITVPSFGRQLSSQWSFSASRLMNSLLLLLLLLWPGLLPYWVCTVAQPVNGTEGWLALDLVTSKLQCALSVGNTGKHQRLGLGFS